MQYLIPGLMLFFVLAIIRYMYKEYKKFKRLEAIKESKEIEKRFIIEKMVMRDLNFCEEYWNANGQFNRTHYVKYLEAKEQD